MSLNEDQYTCPKHPQTGNPPGKPYTFHYGSCAYCILEDTLITHDEKRKICGSWPEEYDSWDEVTSRSLNIIYLGYYDFKRNVFFLDTMTPKTYQPLGEWLTTDTTHFRRLYGIGQQLAKDGVPETTIKMFGGHYCGAI